MLWQSKDGEAHCRGGFRYTGQDLVVPTTGVYRVFLQVTYESKGSDEDEPMVSNSVSVLEESYKKERCILTAFDTVSCSKTWRKTLYTSGLFFLEAHAELRTTSSHHDLIIPSETMTFFGAELVSNSK